MHKVSRTLLVAGVLAFGTLAAACGDKVELVANPNQPTGVTGIAVTPPAATISSGQTIQLAVAVTTADGNTAKTVTWSTSNAAVATVDQTGKVTGGSTAGTASIIATATADATKAAGAAITVTATTPPQAGGIAISSVTAGNTLTPVNLAAVAGQVDVTLFVSGPSGAVRLISNCAAGATPGVDVVVAQQTFAGSQNQTPIVLSYNTAATGTVAAGIATVDNNAATPISLNGNCLLKAQLVPTSGTTVTAANITPFTLTNTNFFRSTVSYTKTTPAAFSAVGNAISASTGLRYDQGDVVVSVSPVVYTTAVGATAAQIPALLSVTFSANGVQAGAAAAPKTITGILPTAGKFAATFPSTGATAANINEYTTTGAAGDNVTITGFIDAVGQPITIGFATANAVCSNALNCVVTPIRVDNGSPATGALAQALNLFTTARNYINAPYSFSANNTPTTDVAFAPAQLTTSFYVGQLTAAGTGGVAPALNAMSVTETSASCSTTGLTKVSTGADVAAATGLGQTPAPYAPSYFVRVIETDPVGNASCQDFGITNGISGFGLDAQAPSSFAVTGGSNGSAANNALITTGAANTYNAVDSISGFNPGGELRAKVRRNWINNSTASCVLSALSSGACPLTAQSFSGFSIDAGSGTQAYYVVDAVAQDQAGNQSANNQRIYLLDSSIPVIGGVSIPQTLAGGASVTFLSSVTDNVDLSTSNFSVLYSAASTNASLYYQADFYGPTFDSTRVTSAPLNANVPFFIKQLQGETAGGAPNAFAAGIGADSGRAASVTVRAIDAANLLSTPVAAAIPSINISNSSGFTTQFATFLETNAAVTLSNGNGTGTPSVALTAQAVFNGATAQQQNLPFTQVCFFFQQTAAGNATRPSIPTGDYVPAGQFDASGNVIPNTNCVPAPAITDVALVSRTWTYTSGLFNPPAYLGTALTLNIVAIGINGSGVGIITPANANITLAP